MGDLTVGELLSRVADPDSSADAGAAVSITAALGVGLMEMSLAITERKLAAGSEREQIEQALSSLRRASLRHAADWDAETAGEWRAALRLPVDTDEQRRRRTEATITSALHGHRTQFLLGTSLVEALAYAVSTTELVSLPVLPDAGAGVHLLRAALLAAEVTQEVALQRLADTLELATSQPIPPDSLLDISALRASLKRLWSRGMERADQALECLAARTALPGLSSPQATSPCGRSQQPRNRNGESTEFEFETSPTSGPRPQGSHGRHWSEPVGAPGPRPPVPGPRLSSGSPGPHAAVPIGHAHYYASVRDVPEDDRQWAWTVNELLSRTASPEPTPSAGSTVPLVVALGVSLLLRALGPGTAEVTDRTEAADNVEIRAQLRELIPQLGKDADFDREIVQRFLHALRGPLSTEEERLQRKWLLQEFLIRGTRGLYKQILTILQELSLAEKAVKHVAPDGRCDAAAGIHLLDGALGALLPVIEANLCDIERRLAGEVFAEEHVRKMLQWAAALRDEARGAAEDGRTRCAALLSALAAENRIG